MKILLLSDEVAVTAHAADILAGHLAIKSDMVLGLATGGTMVPLYDELVRRYRDGLLSFEAVTSFNLDEYIGLASCHPCSYHSYMMKALVERTDMQRERVYLPRGDAPDPLAEAARYEEKIRAAGGIDLQLLGIGANGHIGFNEPHSSLESRTRIEKLTASTRAANQQFFEHEDDVPRFAITMGIATILDARSCLLLATGAAKAAAVAAMIEGPLSAACPASALQTHPRVTIILDCAAASQLRLTNHCNHGHIEFSDRTVS